MPVESKLEFINTSVVILGQDYRPGVLTPDFLKAGNIVGKKWELTEQPISSPVFSQVSYVNGVIFVLEPSRIQIVGNKPSTNLQDNLIPLLAEKFIAKLGYVRHKAVGFNLVGFIEDPNAERFVVERFIKPGTWLDKDLPLRTVALNFVYPFPKATLRFSVEPGKFTKPEREQEGILLTANYQRDIPVDISLEASSREVIDAVSFSSEYVANYHQMVNSIWGLEE